MTAVCSCGSDCYELADGACQCDCPAHGCDGVHHPDAACYDDGSCWVDQHTEDAEPEPLTVPAEVHLAALNAYEHTRREVYRLHDQITAVASLHEAVDGPPAYRVVCEVCRAVWPCQTLRLLTAGRPVPLPPLKGMRGPAAPVFIDDPVPTPQARPLDWTCACGFTVPVGERHYDCRCNGRTATL